MVGIVATAIELVVAVLGNVNVVTPELCSLEGDRILVGQHERSRVWCELVPDRSTTDGVELAPVDHLEYAVGERGSIGEAFVLDDGLVHCPGDTVRVGRPPWDRLAVFVDDGVLVPIDGWIDSQAENVLVVRGHDSGCYDVTVRRHLPLVDVARRQAAGRAGLEVDSTRLVELPDPDVLVVGHGADGLQDEVARSNDTGVIGPVVGVLPKKPIVDFVHAYDVLHLLGFSSGSRHDRIEVLDQAETVAPQVELVGA